MASVRIEDGARTDPRFVILGKKMGTTRQDAIGRMADVWAYCTEKQTYFLSAEILRTLGEREDFEKLLSESDVNLADFDPDKGLFRIRGTRGRIEWLRKLRNNGKKGGRPKKTKTKPEGNQIETKTEPPSNPLTLVPVPVPSPVNLKKEELKARGKSALPEVIDSGVQETLPAIQEPDPPMNQKAAQVIAAYCEAYGERYEGTRPEITGKIAGQVKALLKATPLQRAINLVQVYCQMEDPWFEKKHHDFTTFTENLNKVAHALDTGKSPGGIDWRKVFGGGS